MLEYVDDKTWAFSSRFCFGITTQMFDIVLPTPQTGQSKPNPIFCVMDRKGSAGLATVQTRPTWMQDPVISKKSLLNLLLLDAHDATSAGFSLTEKTCPMNDNAMWLRVANTFKLPEVCQGMSFAQGALPYGLLVAGIRHFDFRLYWDGTDYYGQHGYVGYKLEVYMNSIKAFITCHAPKDEIISITIQGNESITKAKKEVELAAWCYNFFPTGTVLPATFDENDIPILPPQTVAELAKDRTSLLVMYNATYKRMLKATMLWTRMLTAQSSTPAAY